jgi:threonine dehydrogenase-like Zn-dependent dehydrogenase
MRNVPLAPGRPNLCIQFQRMGVDFDGAFAERVLLPQEDTLFGDV